MSAIERFARCLRMLMLWGVIWSAATGAAAESTALIESVEALGMAPYQGKEIGAARQAAVANALSVAMSRVVLKLLPIEAVSTHFGRISELLLARPEPFVNDFRIAGEYTGGGAYRVLIVVNMAVDKVNRELESAGIAVTPGSTPPSATGGGSATSVPSPSDAPSTSPAPRVTLQVDGSDQLGFFVQFRNALREISGVRSIMTSEMRVNQFTLLVEYGGGATLLADSLKRKTFNGFHLEVRDVGEGRLRVGLVAN
jgi:hypothetical protein